MKRQSHPKHDEEMRQEYDFSQGVRGKHFEAYRAGTNVVFLDPDVAKVFTDSASVNQVLRLLLRLASKSIPVEKRLDNARPPASRGSRSKKRPTAKAARD